MTFYGVTIPKPLLPGLILSVEKDELDIPAGLQDRVVQVYEGVVYMDFDKGLIDRQEHGDYEELDPALLPPLYIAYRTDLSEGTEVFHNNIRQRFKDSDPEVVAAMKYWADLAVEVRHCLVNRQLDRIPDLLNRNFDKRRELYKISEGNLRMVDAARSVGASAKFTGSGGAIVGTYRDDAMYDALVATLEPMGIRVFRPVIEPASDV